MVTSLGDIYTFWEDTIYTALLCFIEPSWRSPLKHITQQIIYQETWLYQEHFLHVCFMYGCYVDAGHPLRSHLRLMRLILWVVYINCFIFVSLAWVVDTCLGLSTEYKSDSEMKTQYKYCVKGYLDAPLNVSLVKGLCQTNTLRPLAVRTYPATLS